MDKRTIVLGKKLVSRTETIQWYVDKIQHKGAVIGISARFAFFAWLLKMLKVRNKFIYYCIDFYDPRCARGKWDAIFIWLHIRMDKWLMWKADENWVISNRIRLARCRLARFRLARCKYTNYLTASYRIVPLTYPPTHFRCHSNNNRYRLVYVGLDPYGVDMLQEIVKERELALVTIGTNKKLIDTNEMLNIISYSGIGMALWEKEIDNHYYGDPGKTKLYLVCGIPVIVSRSATFSDIIDREGAGVAVNYDKKSVILAINRILANYDFYKDNAIRVGKEYCNAEKVYKEMGLLR